LGKSSANLPDRVEASALVQESSIQVEEQCVGRRHAARTKVRSAGGALPF
jgi:hypothetical protein